MKKFLPVIIIAIAFSVPLVFKMTIGGLGISAAKIDNKTKKYSLFESEYSKFSHKFSTGENVVLVDLKEPIVIINFWASWCLPCLAEFPSLNKLSENYKGRVKVIGINSDYEDAEKKLKKTIKKQKLKFHSILDEQGDIASQFNIMKVPTSIVFHKGRVIDFISKEFDFSNKIFLKKIEKLLNKK